MKNFIEIECCNCGIIWGVSSVLNKNWLEMKKTFYCPNGHPQSYIKSTADQLRDDINKKNIQIYGLESDIRILKKPKRKNIKKK